jgi:hypothetical protein
MYKGNILVPEDVIRAVYDWIDTKLPADNNILALGFNVRYTEKVSNTHSAPWNGQTNWDGKKPDVPRGYPGFAGRVWIVFRTGKFHDSFGSELPNQTRLFTGTGGYGDYDNPLLRGMTSEQVREVYPDFYPLSWDGRFYMDDWPELKMGQVLERWTPLQQQFYLQKVSKQFAKDLMKIVEKNAKQKQAVQNTINELKVINNA